MDAFDPTPFRAEFPVAERLVYLNHAVESPMPLRTARAAAERIAVAQDPTLERGQREAAGEVAKERLGRLLNVPPGQIAFLTNVSDAVNMVANGLDWRAGDEVVLVEGEFASVVYPIRGLERLGVRPVLVPKDGPATDLARIEAALNSRTRLLAISDVEYRTGCRNDLEALGALCRERDALFLVDASQSLGAQPCDMAAWGADVVTAVAFKWLMGLHGLAVMAVAPAALERIRPSTPGRNGVVGAWESGDYALTWQPDARRYQGGALNWLGIVTLAESLGLIEEIGPPGMAHARCLADRLIAALQVADIQVTSDVRPRHRSQIVSFTLGARSADEALVRRLSEEGVVVCRRGLGVRVGFHCWNNAADLERLIAVVVDAQRALA
jgi:selenocysteine lyase/cysteine desulfurase